MKCPSPMKIANYNFTGLKKLVCLSEMRCDVKQSEIETKGSPNPI